MKKIKCLTLAEFSALGNRARNQSLTAAKRKAIARKAAQTRWDKVKEQR